MIKEKLKIQASIKAKMTIKLPMVNPIEINDAIVFSNDREDGTVLMVVQDKTNPNIQIHISMEKKDL